MDFDYIIYKLSEHKEQNLVDCTGGKYGNHGGKGGTMDNCYRYIIENGGIDTAESYPYETAVKYSRNFIIKF